MKDGGRTIMSNIHAQFVKSPARIFLILEDKKLYDEAFWEEILYPNIEQRKEIDFSNLTSYQIRLDCSSANEFMSIPDSIPSLADCLSNLKRMIQSVDFRTNYPGIRKLEYLLKCLEYCNDVIRLLWNSEHGYETMIEISPLTDVDNVKHPLRVPEQFNFDSGMPQLVFWCLDTDGLQLNQNVLNHQRSHVTVKPLRNFVFSSEKKKSMKKKLAYYQHPQYLSAQTRYTQSHNKFERTSTDHFIILLHPNAEVLSYSMHTESKRKLGYWLNNENVVYKKGGITKHGTRVYIGIALLVKNSSGTPTPTLKEEEIRSVQQLFLNNEVLSYNWSENDADAFLRFVEPSDYCNQEYENNVLSASLYVKKNNKKQHFPLSPILSRINKPIQDIMSFFKWTSCIDEESASMIWSEPHRCNGKTMIPLHPNHVSEEILEKYGRDVYGGFKPCQRIVKNSLRCWDHR